jgi:uncharacterized membrane protein
LTMSDASNSMVVRPPKRNVWLIVSLCLNLALVAVIVGGVINAMRNGHPPPGLFGPHVLIDFASPDERVKIKAVMDAHAGKIEALKKADMAARQTAFAMFSGETLDPAAFEKALDAVDDADDAVRREEVRVVSESVAQLSPAERQALSDKARKRMKWWHAARKFFGGHAH